MVDEPVADYDDKTVSEVQSTVDPYANGLGEISDAKLKQRYEIVRQFEDYEEQEKARSTALASIRSVKEEIDRQLARRDVDPPVSEDETQDPFDDEDTSTDENVVNEPEEEETPKNDSYTGNDGNERILVRNHKKYGRNVVGFSFDAGEVKDLVIDDQIRQAISNNELQVVG